MSDVVNGRVIDYGDSSPISGAAVTAQSSLFSFNPVTAITDSTGAFSMVVPSLHDGWSIYFTAPGYMDTSVSLDDFESAGVIAMQSTAPAGQPAPSGSGSSSSGSGSSGGGSAATQGSGAGASAGTLPSSAKSGLSKTTMLLGGGLLLGAGYAAYRYSKKRGKATVGAVDWQGIAVKAGIALGAYFLIARPIMQKLGILSSNDPSGQDAHSATDIAATDQSVQQAAAINPPTYSDAQYQDWANTIYTQGIGDTDNSVVISTLENIRNTTDALKLAQAFGTRQAATSYFSTCSLLGFNCPVYDLGGFVGAILEASDITAINQYFATNGINYRF